MPPVTVVATGTTSGVGLIAARRLLDVPDLVLATHHRGTRPLAGAVGLDDRRVDLGDLTQVSAWADDLAARLDGGLLPPLGAVVANAGVQVSVGRHQSAQGHELTLAVNHLAHVLLVDRLLPHLEPGGRVVVTSSGTHRTRDPMARVFGIPAPDPVDVRSMLAPASVDGGRRDGMRRYATSKLANAMHVTALAAERPDVVAVAFDPGLVPGTGLVRGAPVPVRAAWSGLAPLLRRLPGANAPEVPGRLLAELATGAATVPSGSYVEAGRGVVEADPAATDLDSARRMLGESRDVLAGDRGRR